MQLYHMEKDHGSADKPSKYHPRQSNIFQCLVIFHQSIFLCVNKLNAVRHGPPHRSVYSTGLRVYERHNI